MKKLSIFIVMAFTFIIGSIQVKGQDDDEVYKNIGLLKGQVKFTNHPELGETPANSMYIVFQRVDCKKCLVGTWTDINGNYELFLGLGEYKLIVRHPAPPVYDMIDPAQPRFIKLLKLTNGTTFDIKLKVRIKK